MALKWRYLTLAVIFLLPLGVMLFSKDVVTAPNSLKLVCQIDSIGTAPQNNNIVIPVLLYNVTDSVSGFELWINTDPEFIRFAAASSGPSPVNAKFDTVGTRIGGWKFFSARILDSLHGLIKVVGICDPDSPRVVQPIPPGYGTLVKLICETNGTIGDSLCDSLIVKLLINKTESRFSNSASPPEIIGCDYYLHIDTVYSGCAVWHGDTCVSWYDTNYVERWYCAMDTLKRVLIDGQVSFICCQCGDANSDGGVDISDAVFLIAYIFGGGVAPGPCGGTATGMGDANGDGGVDISDAVYLIAYIFGGGPAPHCPQVGE